MFKTSKLIIFLLVALMLMSVFSTGIVSVSASDSVVESTINCDGINTTAHVGDKYRYTAYMNVSDIEGSKGMITGLEGSVFYDKSILKVLSTKN